MCIYPLFVDFRIFGSKAACFAKRRKWVRQFSYFNITLKLETFSIMYKLIVTSVTLNVLKMHA